MQGLRPEQWASAGLVAVLAVVGAVLGAPAVTVPVALVTAVLAALTFRFPPFLPVGAVLTGIGLAVIGNGSSSNVVFFGICVVAAWCALESGPRLGIAYLVGALALFAGEWFADHDGGWIAWSAGTTFSAAVGLLARRERDLVVQLRAAQQGLADSARAEERNRIARELHDVIAHCLVVSLLHVSSARVAVEEDPEDAARSLAEAERLGRESLAEVRRAVGLLRADGSPADSAPLPTARDLDALVDRFRAAGASVSLTVAGDVASLPATTGLGVYRIAQEALTNAVKHAPGAPTSVRLTRSADGVCLEVDTAAAAGEIGHGVGLLSMQERAASLNGRCRAGRGGSGWLVRADLPVDAALAPPPGARA